MNRWVGLLNLVQAGVFIGLGTYFSERWAPAAWTCYAAGGLQAIGGLVLLGAREVRIARIAAAFSLVAAAVLVGLHLQAVAHIVNTFTPTGGEQGYAVLGIVAAGLPWVSFFPLWQLLASRPGRIGQGTAALVALLILLPTADGWRRASPTRELAAVDGAAAATWLYQAWAGQSAGAPPEGAGPVLIAASLVRAGARVETRTAEGDDLPSALRAIRFSQPVSEQSAVYLDIAVAEGRISPPILLRGNGTVLGRIGEDALRGADGVVSTLEAWRSPQVVSRSVTYGVTVPAVRLSGLSVKNPTHRVRMRTFMASAEGTVAVHRTWSAPQPTTPDALLAAALAGGLHIASNMADDGEYAYIIQGPSGEEGKGYNFPRHAGATWFLARLYKRTGDERIGEAARKGIAYMVKHTRKTPDGRAYVQDPTRKDGKAWVGTTGLGVLGIIEMGVEPELTAQYIAFIASAVDDSGVIRGDMNTATFTWPEQDEITYAQGQGLLALAAAERAKVPGATAAFDRARAYVDGDYWPMPAAYFKTLDEHWMCLAAAAVESVRGEANGQDVCSAYLGEVALNAPHPGGPIQPYAGGAAGLAEAVIARAELDRRAGVESRYLDRAKAYGDLLMENAYQASDAPLLGDWRRLVGGFRDRPWVLDVRVDAVQHIGCALLGLEQLLRGEPLPGGMP